MGLIKTFLIASVIGIVAYFLAFKNYNDLVLLPFNLTWMYCHHFGKNCFSRLEYWENFAIRNMNWDLERYKPNAIQRVVEIDASEGFTFEKLRKLTEDFTVPAVFRGLFNGSEAVRRWNDPNYFIDNFGDDILIVLENGGVVDAERYAEADLSSQLKTVKEVKSRCETGYSSVQKAKEMSVRDAVSGMVNGKKYYLSNVDTIFRKHNNLLDMVEIPERVTPWAYPDYRPSAAQIFMGYGRENKSETTGTSLHCAWGTNGFVQVVGCKKWELTPNRYSAFINPSLSRKFPAAVGMKYPEWVPRLTTTLCAGDYMLNPSWFWHRIENQPGFNIGIATRENHPLWQWRNAPGMTLLHELGGDNKVSRDAIDWMMKNETEEKRNRIKMFMSIPLLAFSIGYVQEFFGGLRPHPIIDAWTNTCDEHDPRCAASFYDRMVYSYDECIKGKD